MTNTDHRRPRYVKPVKAVFQSSSIKYANTFALAMPFEKNTPPDNKRMTTHTTRLHTKKGELLFENFWCNAGFRPNIKTQVMAMQCQIRDPIKGPIANHAVNMDWKEYMPSLDVPLAKSIIHVIKNSVA